MMTKRTFLMLYVILSVIWLEGANGLFDNWFSSTTYADVAYVSPERVASRLAPPINKMAEDLVNAEKKSREELEQFISEFIQNLSSSFSDDLKSEAKSVKEILREIMETKDMAKKNFDELHETKQAINKTKGEIDRVEDEELASYDLLAKIVSTLDKQVETWTIGWVCLAVSLGMNVLLVLMIAGLLRQICRHSTNTEMSLRWLLFCATAQGRFKHELRPNTNANRELSCIKKDLEYVNPLLTNGTDNYY